MSAGFDKFAWLRAIYSEPAFTSGEKGVLAHVAVFNVLSGNDTFCVRQSTLAKQSGISRATVNYAIGKAKHRKYLVVSRRRASGYGRSGADELRLSLPAVSQDALHESSGGRAAVSQDALHDSDETPSDVKKTAESCQENGPSDVKKTAESCQENGPSDVKKTAESCQAPNTPTSENDTPYSSLKQFSKNRSGGEGAEARTPTLDAHPQKIPSTRLPAVPDGGDPIDGELVDAIPTEDPEPPRFCSEHAANPGKGCHTCKYLRHKHEAWEARRNARMLAAVNARDRERQANSAPAPSYRCRVCHDDGIVLNSDGLPGRDIRICHHDNTWHVATPDELAELDKSA